MGLSIQHLIVLLVIVLLVFGTKKLKSLGGDLGGALKGFKDAMADNKKEGAEEEAKRVVAESPQPNTAHTDEKHGETIKPEHKS